MPEGAEQASPISREQAADSRVIKAIPPELKERLFAVSSRLADKTGYELIKEADRLVERGTLQRREYRGGTGKSVIYFVPHPDYPSEPRRGGEILELNWMPDFHRGQGGEVALPPTKWDYDSEGREVNYASPLKKISSKYHANGEMRERTILENLNGEYFLEVDEFDERGREIFSTRTDTKKGFVLHKMGRRYNDDGSQINTNEFYNHNNGSLYTRSIDSYRSDRTHIDATQFFNAQAQAEKEEVRRYDDASDVNKLTGGEIRYFDGSGAVVRTEEIPLKPASSFDEQSARTQ